MNKVIVFSSVMVEAARFLRRQPQHRGIRAGMGILL